MLGSDACLPFVADQAPELGSRSSASLASCTGGPDGEPQREHERLVDE